MEQLKEEKERESLEVFEYLEKRRNLNKEKIKKDQEKFPEPFLNYSSLLLLSL